MYGKLEELLETTNKGEILIILGDWNAIVVGEREKGKGIGKSWVIGTKERND